MSHKTYRSEAARKLAEQKAARKKKEQRKSQKFGGSNRHMDSRGQSGQERRR